MVTYKEIRAANALVNDANAPRVAVFAGGTSGISKITIKALVSTGTSTSEGFEITQVLAYYSRMLFILHFLPLLEKAKAGRVVSVFSGGLERATINFDDLGLTKPENYGGMKSHTQFGTMNTIFMDKLAVGHPGVTFMHSWPGMVYTGNIGRSADPGSILAWIFWLVVEPIIYLISFSDEDSGQRHLFQSSSSAFGGRRVPWKGKVGVNSRSEEGDGLFLVNYKCECTPSAKVITVLREKGQEKVWDHTNDVLRRYL
ncbi:hypothetical protein EJ08DRAFT_683245 [Tothia fuscella]|uniref:Uncharacterized protein n=1 Tax=Tothia fuscella TaxID=1048955 RepID=A0A9P4NGU0_9PEZI|nr:hypothetical protein EJ08DRAFT_683245 [Tothia fuscella]